MKSRFLFEVINWTEFFGNVRKIGFEFLKKKKQNKFGVNLCIVQINQYSSNDWAMSHLHSMRSCIRKVDCTAGMWSFSCLRTKSSWSWELRLQNDHRKIANARIHTENQLTLTWRASKENHAVLSRQRDAVRCIPLQTNNLDISLNCGNTLRSVYPLGSRLWYGQALNTGFRLLPNYLEMRRKLRKLSVGRTNIIGIFDVKNELNRKWKQLITGK